MKSKTRVAGKIKSGSIAATENIGPKVVAGDEIVSRRLDCRPIVGVEKGLIGEPVGNGLLSERRPVHVLGNAFGEGRLGAAADRNGALERSNVRFLHAANITNPFVSVNNPVCVTANKETCTVLQMPAIKRKPANAPVKSSARVAVPGSDGKTLGQRLHEAMAYESGRRGREYRQSDLIEDVRRLSGSEGDGKLQQSISAIMTGKVSKSSLTPFIASACHVDAIWLSSGLGSMIPKH